MADTKRKRGGAAKVTDLQAVREQVETRARDELGGGPGDGGGPGVSSEFVLECLQKNELGDGELYARINRGRFVHNKSSGEWLRWSGHHWERDSLDCASAAVEDVVAAYMLEADRISLQINDQIRGGSKPSADLVYARERIFKRVQRLRSRGGREACLDFAHKCREPLAIKGDELDADPWLLAFSNGVADLRTGERRDGRPEDWLCKASPLEFDAELVKLPPEEAAPTWWAFLMDIFQDDREMVDFVLRLLGYGITGLSIIHKLPVFWGEGRNGKGVLQGILLKCLGDHACVIEPEMLLDQGKGRSSAGPSPDTMQLHGRRIVFAEETEQGGKLAAARVKRLTGGGALTGRWPHDKRPITFDPTHLLFLLTNHRPRAGAEEVALWDRLLLIPFNMRFVENPKAPNERPQDPDLPKKLEAELPGIMATLVRGCLEFQQLGLRPPASVTAATDDYRKDEDLLAQFLDEECVVGDEIEAKATDLYERFEAWFLRVITRNKNKVWSQNSFGRSMKKRFEKEKRGGIYWYLGVGLFDRDHEG